MINDTDIENIEVSNIVLLDKDDAGDTYMERLFPLWTDVIVFSLEGKYPSNPLLREKVIELLKTDTNLNILVYGANSEKFETASQKRLNMFGLFMLDLRRYAWQEPVIMFDEWKIVEISRAFCIKKDTNRLQSYNLYIDVHIESSIQWYHTLVRS